MAQRLEVFETSGSIFLGIAYIWDQPEAEGYKWYSLLWRWNRNGFVLLEETLHPPASTLNPRTQTLNPKPKNPNPNT
jgi:hypothetical protein